MNTFEMKTENGDCKSTLTVRAQDNEPVTMDPNTILVSSAITMCNPVTIETVQSENDSLPREEAEKGIKQELCMSYEPNKALVHHETKAEDMSIKGVTEHCSDKVFDEADVGSMENLLPEVQCLGSIKELQIKKTSCLIEQKHSDSCVNAGSDNVLVSDAKLVASDEQKSMQFLPLDDVTVVQKSTQGSELNSCKMLTFPQSSEGQSGTCEGMFGLHVITKSDTALSFSEQNTHVGVLPINSCQTVEDSICKDVSSSPVMKELDESNSVSTSEISGKETSKLRESTAVSTLRISNKSAVESKGKPANLNLLVTDKNRSARALLDETNLGYSEAPAGSEDMIENMTTNHNKGNFNKIVTQFQQKTKSEPELKRASDESCKPVNEKTEKFIHKRGTSLPDSAKKFLNYSCETSNIGNENINRQHVDFEAARKQWLMLEMANKSQKPGPNVGPNLIQNKEPGLHKCPGRLDQTSVKGLKSIESFYITSQLLVSNGKENQRQVKKVSIEQKNLKSFQGTTLKEGLKKQEICDINKNALVQDVTPCFEDSGIIDSSTASLNDDGSAGRRYKDPNIPSPDDTVLSSVPSDCLSDEFYIASVPSSSTPSPKSETPIEKEIRQSLEREESLRLSRGISKALSSDDYVNIMSLPSKAHSLSVSPSGKPKQLAEMQMQREILMDQQRETDLVQQRRSTCVSDKSINKETENMTLDASKQICSTPNFAGKQLSPWVANSSAMTSLPVNISSPLQGSSYCEMVADHVIILENDVLIPSQPRVAPDASAPSEWVTETANLVILETPNILIHSAMENVFFPLSKMEPNYSIQNNPFFKLRSSGSPILDQEIRKAHEREDELRRQRDSVYGKVFPKATQCIMHTPEEISDIKSTSSVSESKELQTKRI